MLVDTFTVAFIIVVVVYSLFLSILNTHQTLKKSNDSKSTAKDKN